MTKYMQKMFWLAALALTLTHGRDDPSAGERLDTQFAREEQIPPARPAGIRRVDVPMTPAEQALEQVFFDSFNNMDLREMLVQSTEALGPPPQVNPGSLAHFQAGLAQVVPAQSPTNTQPLPH